MVMLVFDELFSSLAECCGSMRSVVCAVRRFVFNFYGWYVVVNICKYIVGCCGLSLWPVTRRGPLWPVTHEPHRLFWLISRSPKVSCE